MNDTTECKHGNTMFNCSVCLDEEEKSMGIRNKEYCELCYQEITSEDVWRWGRYGEPHCNFVQFGVPQVVCP